MRRSLWQRGRRGFSMIEMLVSLSIFSMVVLGLHRLTISSERSQEVGSRITHVNQDLRAAMEIISRDLRTAGSGFAGLPVQTANGPVRELIYPVTPGYTLADDADSISVLAGLDDVSTLLAEKMTGPSSEMKCVSLEGFSPGDLVVVTDGVFADMFEATEVEVKGGGPGGVLSHGPSRPSNDPNGHSQWPAGGYAAGSRVAKVSRITLKAADDQGDLRLFRKVNDGPSIPLVGNVNRLTFTYRMSDGTETRNPSSPAGIREVIIKIEAGLRSGWGLDGRSVVTGTSVRPRSV